MKSYVISLFIIGIALCASSIHAQTSVTGVESFSAADILGVAKDGNYTNKYFGFELKFPTTWSVLDQEETEATKKMGSEFLKGDDGRPNRLLDESLKTEMVLLQISKKPIGAVENAMFVMAIQKQPSSAVLPKMVAEATKSVMLKSANILVVKDTNERMIGGKRFALVDYEIEVGAVIVSVRTFVTVIKGYALSFSLSKPSTLLEPDLEKIADSISFTAK
jgi:hypothetical protein